jgi:beta-lactamase class A
MSSNTLSGQRRRKRSIMPFIQSASVIMILAAIGILIFYLVNFSQRQERLPSEITIAGVPVGGLSRPQALNRLESAFREPVVVYYLDSPILLDPTRIGFQINGEAMLASASAAGDLTGSFWGRFGSFLLGNAQDESAAIELQASYDENLLEQFLLDISSRYDRASGEALYDLQTLTLQSGSAGNRLDSDAALPLVDAALRSPTSRVVSLPVTNTSVNEGNIATLQRMIESYLDSAGFAPSSATTVASVYVLDLRTGEEVNINSDVAFSAASIIKVPIMLDYFRQLWLAVPPDEAWLMANSLLCSNNSSSNLMMQIIAERVAGQNDIFRGIQDVTENVQYLGARNTFITAPLFLGVEGEQLGSIAPPQTSPNPNFNTNPDPFNQTTAEDMGTLFSLIYDCANYGSGLIAAYPDGEYSQSECRQMLELMRANDLLRLLQGGIPPSVPISHKNGWVNDMSGDAGIVFPPSGRDYVIVTFLWERTEFQDYERLWPLIEGVSRAAWNYFNPEQPLISARTDLPVSAQLCEGNYLPPSPELVDLNNINGWRSGAISTPVPTSSP